jgi:hypothetical protein
MANLVPLSKSSLIKSQKSAIIKSDKFLAPRIKSSSAIIKFSGKTSQTLEGGGVLNDILKKVIQIDKVLKDSLLLSKKENEKKRVVEEKKDFDKREKELEKNKPKPILGIKLPSPPKMGFLDWIKNFITQTILGFFAVRLIDFLPQLLKILPVIIKVGDFFIDVGGKMLDGLVTFVDKSYELVDRTRQFTKDIGGNGLAQNFDKFAGALSTMLDVAIIAALSTASMGGDNGGGGRPGRGGDWRTEGNVIKGKGGYKQTYDNMLKKGNLTEGEKRVVRDYKRLVKAGYHPDSAANQAFWRNRPDWLSGRNVRGGGFSVDVAKDYRTAARGGIVKPKTVLKFVRPFTKRLPIIGGLLDFGLSVALGEPLGRAAFKAIGATLLGTIGAALGGPFAILTGLAGGVAGDWAGGALYDVFFGNKKPQGKTAKAAGGGKPATRGGQPVSGPAKRTLKKKKTPRTLKATPSKLKPGAAIGGEKKIKELYPEPKDKTKMNPFNFIKGAYEGFAKSKGLGTLTALAIKPLMGDKPSYADYKNAAVGINNWMNQSVGSGTLAYAGGGEVKMESLIGGEDYSDVIAKSLQDSVAPQVDKTIQDLMRQMMLKKEGGGTPTKPASDEDVPEGTGSLTGNTNAEKVFNYLIGYGFTEQAAAGVIGNLMQESSVNPQSRQLGGGPGRGIMQWGTGAGSGGRWDALVAWAESSGKDPWKLDTQVEWMMKEMRSYGTLNRLKGVTNVKKAVEIFESEMEKAGTPNYPRRYQLAADALASFGKGRSGGKGAEIELGKGYGGAGSKIAGELGRYIKQQLKQGPDFQAVTEHPEHGGVVGGHAKNSYHYSGRAIDIGAYSHEQSKILNVISQFNKMKGIKPVELLHAGNEPSGHSDHVHVAYEKGGKVGGFTKAILGEKGPEFVIDADSTRALEDNFPGFLDALNKAKYNQAIEVLMNYASYNQPTQIIKITKQVPVPLPMPMGGGGSTIIAGGSGSNYVNSNMKQTLAQIG